jgi:uroporphyrinogen decarboxylase
MTSRERVWEAVNHREPDQIPVDVGGTKVTGIHIDEYCDLVRWLGLDLLPLKCYEQFQMLARVDYEVRLWFGSDVIQLENPVETWGLPNRDWQLWATCKGNQVLMPGTHNPVLCDDGNYRLYNNGVSVAYRPPDALYYERDCKTGMSDEIVFADPAKWAASMPLYSDEELKQLQKQAKFYHDNTGYSIHGGFMKGGLGTVGIFAGHTFGDWMCILLTEPEYANEILEATARRVVQNLALYLQAVGDYIDTIMVSGVDYGTQDREMFSPDIFHDLYVPNFKIINGFVHEKCRAKVMFHTCGSIYHIIRDLIDCGVDILNPIHTNAANMQPERLKMEFGDDIVFWGGGIETQSVLPKGSREEIENQVKERLDVFGRGGGFVFAVIHNIQYGVPPKNLAFMVEALNKYKRRRNSLSVKDEE